jgi:hypothetical protein
MPASPTPSNTPTHRAPTWSVSQSRRTAPIKAALAPAWTEFHDAAQVAQVRRTVTKKGKKTVEVACLITSDRSADPATLAAWARGHWHIENKLHWVHDVTYQEDKSLVRTSNAPQVTATLRLSNQPSAPGGPRQHRGRQPAPRPRSAADAQATSGGMNDFAGSLSPWYCCRRWLSSASPPSTACSDRGSKLFITGNGSRGCGPTISTSRHGI